MGKGLVILAAALLVCVAVGVYTRRGTETPSSGAGLWHSYRTFAFNTDCRLQLNCADAAAADAAAADCLALLASLHQTLDRFAADSPLSRFNRLPPQTPFPCDELLWAAFDAARTAAHSTGGAFDITIGPLLAYWRGVANGESPDETKRQEASRRCGFGLLAFGDADHTVAKTVDGVQADFGGLAKGLALDLVRERLLRHGIKHCLLDFGGNIYLNLPPGMPDAVAVSDPRQEGALLCTLDSCNGRFVATSSDAHRALAPGRISHVIDPRSGQPAAGLLSATAVADTGAASDFLSTAAFVTGEEWCRQAAENNPGIAFVLLEVEGGIARIGGGEDSFFGVKSGD